MARGGQTRDRDDAERKCIVTGEVQPKAGLIRFVVGPDNQVVPDILGKLPGRGMYVTADRAALDAAGKGQFSRSAKQPVTVPDHLAEEVERAVPGSDRGSDPRHRLLDRGDRLRNPLRHDLRAVLGVAFVPR